MAVSGRSRIGAGARRRSREREIVLAARALFDERGTQDASIDDIARAVGLNKAIIYRHFASKEELFVVAVTLYLADLAERLAEVDEEADPITRLREGWERYADFCLEFPAFLDCALSLMRRPAEDLRERVSDAVWLRLGQGMAACLGPLSRILDAGARAGVFTVDDPDLVANRLYVQTLGTMHLARIGVGVRLAAPGVPDAFAIDPHVVRDACVRDTLAAVGAPQPSAPSIASAASRQASSR